MNLQKPSIESSTLKAVESKQIQVFMNINIDSYSILFAKTMTLLNFLEILVNSILPKQVMNAIFLPRSVTQIYIWCVDWSILKGKIIVMG